MIKMRKQIVLLGVALVSLKGFSQEHDHTAHAKEETVKTGKSLSPHTSAMAMVGDAHVHIDYSSPRVRERIIFGGLVGYNTVWQAGAHKATWLETNKDLKVGGKVLPAGKYGFFVVPGKEEWKVMFNSHWDQHGKDEYSAAQDVLVTKVKAEKLKEVQEELTYEVLKTGDKAGVISLSWEKVKISLPFEVL